MMGWILHIGIIALIALFCVKYKFWVPMLITLVLSLIYFGSIVYIDSPVPLWPIIFYIWPPFYTLLSLLFWALFRKMGVDFNSKKL
ncbi:MAG: hypothetical protein CMF14_06165 [Idiomarina sp.]|nr:hypothetical protein [Idiomarina sp.]